MWNLADMYQVVPENYVFCHMYTTLLKNLPKSTDKKKLNNSIKGEQKARTVHGKRNAHLHSRAAETCHHPRADGGERQSLAANLHTGPWGKAPTPDVGIPGPRELPIGTFSNIQKCSWAQTVTLALSVTVKDCRGDTNKTVPSETVWMSSVGDGGGDVSVWHTPVIRSLCRGRGKRFSTQCSDKRGRQLGSAALRRKAAHLALTPRFSGPQDHDPFVLRNTSSQELQRTPPPALPDPDPP